MRTFFRNSLFAFVLCCGLFSGCATQPGSRLAPLTHYLVNEIRPSRLGGIQVHLSSGIRLSREDIQTEAGVYMGTALIERSQQRSEVNLGSGLPGVVVGYEIVTNEWGRRVVLEVAFEAYDGRRRPTLFFSTIYNPTNADVYYLVFPDWERRTVRYDRNDYTVTFQNGLDILSGNRPFLTVRSFERSMGILEERDAGGLNVNDAWTYR